MKQRIHRPKVYPDYTVTPFGHHAFTSPTNYTKLKDRELMKRFIHDYLYSNMSTQFIQICNELGARGYNPEYNEIKARLR